MTTVTFQTGYDGKILTRWQGKIAFPARTGPQPRAGETWEVDEAALNPRGTVYFLTLGTRSVVPQGQLEDLRLIFERRRLDWSARRAAA